MMKDLKYSCEQKINSMGSETMNGIFKVVYGIFNIFTFKQIIFALPHYMFN